MSNIIKNGAELKKADTSVKKFLEDCLLQYSSLQTDICDNELLFIKNVSFDIMNNYDDFLFIVKLLDNDFLFTNIVKFLIGKLNSDLIKKKIYIKI